MASELDAKVIEAINAFKARREAEAMTPEGQINEFIAPRGPTPEQAAINDSIEAFKARRRGADTRRTGIFGPPSQPVGVYPDNGDSNNRVLDVAPSRPAKREIVRPVFENDEAFSVVEKDARKALRPFNTNINHWQPPKQAKPYLPKIREVEKKHAMPYNMMAALLHAESMYNPKAVSKAGAKGIAQIMPKYHPKAKVDDPEASIEYGAEYLTKLKNRFGSWELALAAYNWGPKNLRKYGIEKAPKETRDYVKKIMSKIHVEEEE